MTVTLMSFGFSKGRPATYDVLFDARGITNPAKKLGEDAPDGRDQDIQRLVIQDPKAKAVVRSVVDLAKEHPNAVVAIGCRYGKHRSVALVERIARGLTSFTDTNGNKLSSNKYHLDLNDEYETFEEAKAKGAV